MSQIVRNDVDALNIVLTVTINKEDYLDKVLKEIRKYSQRANVKGFRPGKAPAPLIQKMHGNAFLLGIINEDIHEILNNYLQEEKIEYLGSPLLSKQQPQNIFNINNPQDLSFNFDLGLKPQFQLKGLEGAHFEKLQAAVPEHEVDAEWKKFLKMSAKQVDVDTQIEENDILKLRIKEIGGTLENVISVSVEWLTDDMKSVFLTQQKGNTLQINIFQLEKDTDSDYVKKYLLGLGKDDTTDFNENFDAEIIEVKRLVLPEVNQEFLSKYFGENVQTETEARNIIRNHLSRELTSFANAILYKTAMKQLTEVNVIPLPESFLKRWLEESDSDKKVKLTDDSFNSFLKSMRYHILKSKVIEIGNVKITEQDLGNAVYDRLKSMSNFDLDLLADEVNDLVDKMLSHQSIYEQLFDSVKEDKILEVFEQKANITVVNTTPEQLKETYFKLLNAQKTTENTELTEGITAQEVTAEL